jgi:hypothetical protein
MTLKKKKNGKKKSSFPPNQSSFRENFKTIFPPYHSLALLPAITLSLLRRSPSVLRRVLRPPASISPSLSLPRLPSLSSGAHPLSSGEFFGHRRSYPSVTPCLSHSGARFRPPSLSLRRSSCLPRSCLSLSPAKLLSLSPCLSLSLHRR